MFMMMCRFVSLFLSHFMRSRFKSIVVIRSSTVLFSTFNVPGPTSPSEESPLRDWKALTDGGIAAQYWAQEDGSWVKKAEKSAN